MFYFNEATVLAIDMFAVNVGVRIVVNILNLKKYNESIKDLFKDLWTLQGAGEQSPTCRYST
jgi:hypothetical protein